MSMMLLFGMGIAAIGPLGYMSRGLQTTAAAQPADLAGDAGQKGTDSAATHGEHPPIDCPLRRAGIDPHKLKPFEEVEKYIAFLERPERLTWQKPDEVVKALQLRGSEKVADVGAGSGYFAFRFARALPRGKVVAIDTQPEMVRHMHHKARQQGVSNLQAQVATPDDPKIPPDADLVFICDVLHHVGQKSRWLKRLHCEMKSGARLVVLEFKEGKLPAGPPEKLKIPKRELIVLLKSAGFDQTEDRSNLLPYQTFLVFEKP